MRAEFQMQSSARIQLSRANEYFPGTSDRIMLISGSVGQVCRTTACLQSAWAPMHLLAVGSVAVEMLNLYAHVSAGADGAASGAEQNEE